MTPLVFLPLLSLGTPLAILALRNRSGNGGNGGNGGSGWSGGGRHSGGAQLGGAQLGGAQLGGAPADPQGAAPDPRFGGVDTAFSPVAVAANSVLPSAGVSSDGAQSGFVQSSGQATASGDPFPTTGRALAMTGGHALMGLGLLILLLSASPTGHHDAHIGAGAVGLLGFAIFFVGASFTTFATGRVQRDVMGGGWNSRIATRYISPQIALYVLSPAGISAAANRLNIAPVLAMFVIYGLLAADVLLMVAHYFGR